MKKFILVVALGLPLTSCYQFNREQREKDAESKGRAILFEAESSKKAKIEEAKADLESAKLDKETIEIKAQALAKKVEIDAEAKAQAIEKISEAIRKNPEYLKYLAVDGMYNHGNTIFIPTESGNPIIYSGK